MEINYYNMRNSKIALFDFSKDAETPYIYVETDLMLVVS